VQTWTFLPARSSGNVPEARIGIVFQFPGSLSAVRAPKPQRYEGSVLEMAQRAALPQDTPEPETTQKKQDEGSVILRAHVNSQGQVGAVEVVCGPESLTPATVAAARQWHFVPGRRGGANSDSEVIVVVTFRRSATAARMSTSKLSR
jgi:TonB family protein